MAARVHRPIIGIPCGVFPELWYTPTNGNAISYLRAVEAAGGIPTLIHLTRDAEVLQAHYERIDALLLAGGEDVDPAHYNAVPHPKLGKPNPLQDAVEIELTRRAIADRKPIFGICRGIQLLNVAMGGTLYQDIPSELPGALDHSASDKQRDMSYIAHPIELTPDCWIAERLDTTKISVNTLHHQALRDVAAGLRVVATAPDGVVEAVEGTGAGFIIAVQSHPEEMWDQTERRWTRIFEGFVQQARG